MKVNLQHHLEKQRSRPDGKSHLYTVVTSPTHIRGQKKHSKVKGKQKRLLGHDCLKGADMSAALFIHPL